MPAHLSEDNCERHRKSDGSPLRPQEVKGNDRVDVTAKTAASLHRLPEPSVESVQNCWDRTLQLALWIGRVTVAANHFELPGRDARGNRVFIRDAGTGCARQTRRGAEYAQRCRPPVPGPPEHLMAMVPSSARPRVDRRVHMRRAAARDDLNLLRAVHERATDCQPQEITAAERMEALRRRVRSRNQQ